MESVAKVMGPSRTGRELGASTSTGKGGCEFPHDDLDVIEAGLIDDVDVDVFRNGFSDLELDNVWFHAEPRGLPPAGIMPRSL